jgi:uncharacterized OsmC-like protein
MVTRNGIDEELWNGVKQEIRERPEEAKVIVRTVHHWTGGFGFRGRAKTIESVGEITERSFQFSTDWPEDVAGSDTGPSPGEALLGALGGCIGLSFIASAVNRGVEIDQLEIDIEARADLQAVFDAGDARPGLSSIDIFLRVRADAEEQTLVALGEAASRTSTVFDSLVSPVPISIGVQTHH